MSWRVLVTAVASVASAVILLILIADHTTGGEIDGVLVAGLAVATGLGGLASLVRHAAGRRLVLVLWLLVAAGGGMGYLDHAELPKPGHAVIDDRPRPPFAPLVFTVIGLAGVATVISRPRLAPAGDPRDAARPT
jgi:hypothetical protein